MNKNGQIGGALGDYWLITMIVFAFVFSLTIGYTIWVNFNNQIQGLDNIDQDVKDEINSWTNYFFFLDKLTFFLFFILWGAVISSSILTNPEHPFFFIVSLGITLIITFMTFIVADFGNELFESPALISYSSALSNSNFFVSNIHIISFFIMVATTVFFFSKGRYVVGSGVQ